MAKDDVLILIAEVGDQPVGYCQAVIGSRPPVKQTERYLLLDRVVAEAVGKQGAWGRLLAAD